jgi:filamentous hemagglutinin family protein
MLRQYRSPLRFVSLVLAATLLSGLSASAYSQIAPTITADGTLGTTVVQSGNVYDIDGGTIIGGINQFHSFDLFSVRTGDIASFNGPAGIENVLSRVTGADASIIDGTIRSTIPGANFFFLNPKGVVFGENASLDVSRSFHASTADFLRLVDGGIFHASSPELSLLTTAPPSAFGFLGPNPAAIQITGSFLVVPEGETLSLTGGDIDVGAGPTFASALFAPSGRIDLVSVASAGEAVLTDGDIGVAAFDELGTISIVDFSLLNVSGERGGDVYVRGGQLVMNNNARMVSFTLGNADGGTIDIGLTDRLEVRRGADITAVAFNGVGHGADVTVAAKTIVLSGDGANPVTGIAAQVGPQSAGNAGNVTITADSLEVRDGAVISASTFGAGDAGDLGVTADTIFLSRDGAAPFTGIAAQANSGSTGNAGNLTVATTSLEVRDGADISASTFGAGDAGDLTVAAKTVFLSGNGASGSTGIGSGAESGSTGNAGNLTLTADRVEVRDGADIGVSTRGAGHGGDLSVTADTILLFGNGGASFTGITGQANFGSTGDAGNLSVTAGNIEMHDGAAISTNTLGDGKGGDLSVAADTILLFGDGAPFTGIAAQAGGNGDAGNLAITANSIEMHDGADIDASTFGLGNGGNLIIVAETLEVRSGADISVSTFTSGKGGNTTITADSIFLSRDTAASFTGIAAQAVGSGNVGSLTVSTNKLEVRNGASISGTTFGAGKGGDVSVTADAILLAGDGAEPFTGIAGQAVGSGDAANLAVAARNLEVRDGAAIGAGTFGAGDGGNVSVTADTILLFGNGGASFTGIGADANLDSSGKGGNVLVAAGNLVIVHGAEVSAGTLSSGRGGNIEIHAQRVELRDGGAIQTTSIGSGLAGDIFVEASDALEMFSGSVNAEAIQSDGGNITINANNLVYLVNSEITTAVQGGAGAGGNITIDPQFVVLNKSRISANAFGGPGGNIRISAGNFIVSADSTLSASSAQNIAGTVVVESPENDIAGSVSQLPQDIIDVSGLLPERCAARQADGQSSFVVAGRGGVAPHPDGYLPTFRMGGVPRSKARKASSAYAMTGPRQARKGEDHLLALASLGCR